MMSKDFSGLYIFIAGCFLSIFIVVFLCYLFSIKQFALSSVISTFFKSIAISIFFFVAIVVAMIFYRDAEKEKQIEVRKTSIQKQTQFYSRLQVLKKLTIKFIKEKNKIKHIRAKFEMFDNALLDDYSIQLVVFAKPKKNVILLDYTIYESDNIPIKISQEGEFIGPIDISSFTLEDFIDDVGESYTLEYVLTVSKIQVYASNKNYKNGVIFTSLSKQYIAKRRGVLNNEEYSRVSYVALPHEITMNNEFTIEDFNKSDFKLPFHTKKL
ncbi:MAG: hypothetical protein V5786_12030 [Psychromonas sp.]